jgi:hypothetical protein
MAGRLGTFRGHQERLKDYQTIDEENVINIDCDAVHTYYPHQDLDFTSQAPLKVLENPSDE